MRISKWYQDEENMNLNILKCVKASSPSSMARERKSKHAGVWHTPLNRLFIINISLIYCHLVHDFGLCACQLKVKCTIFMINETKHALNQWSIDITIQITPPSCFTSQTSGANPRVGHPSSSPPPPSHRFGTSTPRSSSAPQMSQSPRSPPQLHLNCCKSCSMDKST